MFALASPKFDARNDQPDAEVCGLEVAGNPREALPSAAPLPWAHVRYTVIQVAGRMMTAMPNIRMTNARRNGRRTALSLLARLGLAAAGIGSVAAARAQPSYTVSSAQLQAAVAERFPRTYPVGGFLELKVEAPQLRLIPDQNRLGTVMHVDAAGPALRRSYDGIFDTDFALRYEPSDLTIRAHQLRVNALRLNGLPRGQSALLDAYGPSMAEQALQDAVLHQLTPKDLALPDAMGLQPGGITVTSSGLVIGFVAKTMR